MATDRQVTTPFFAALLAGLLLGGLPALAAADTPDWQALSPEQREVLSQFKDRWSSLAPEKRERLINRAERWRSLPPERREAIRSRWEALRQIPPEQRDVLRQRWQSLSPEERRKMAEDLYSPANP